MKRILILGGGISKERDVSLETAKQVNICLKKKFKTIICEPDKNLVKNIKKFKPTIIFNALHGRFGEDGYIQSILEKIKIKYTHSGIISSFISMNKILSKELFIKNKILTPKFIKYDFDVLYLPGSTHFGWSIDPQTIPLDDNENPIIQQAILASSTISSWSELDKELIEFDVNSEMPGPLPLSVIVDINGELPNRAYSSSENSTSSIVLVGDTDFFSNNYLESANNLMNDLKIKTNQLNLISSKFSIESLGGNNSIQLNNGNINDINFSKLDVLINKNNKIFYKGTHNLFAEDLDKLGIIKSSDFKYADIKTSILSRGSIDPSDPVKNKTFYKIDIFNSNLTFNSGYLVSAINSSLYSDLNGGLYGSFSSSLPLQDAIQDINGSVLYIRNKGLELVSSFNIDMEKLINPNPYFSLSGKESFETSFKITPEQKLTLTLNTDLQETYIFSTIDEISKPLGKPLFTSIKIPSLVDPTYEISNELFKAYIGHAGEEGYFIFGDYGGNIKEKDGFHIYLDLDLFDFSSVRFDATAEGESFVKTISLRAKEFKMLNNSFVDQFINLNFKKSGLFGNFKGSDLNGELIVDNTGFSKVVLNKTTIENLNFISRTSQVTSNINDSSLINMRIQGSEISIAGENFESIDFYVLRNKSLITIEDINITSDYINIYPLDSGENAFVSYSTSDDLYKIKGSFEIDGSSKFIKDSLNYDFDFLNTELSIQWNSIEDLINLEGKVKFLTKDFTVENDISSSAFLNALKMSNN